MSKVQWFYQAVEDRNPILCKVNMNEITYGFFLGFFNLLAITDWVAGKKIIYSEWK